MNDILNFISIELNSLVKGGSILIFIILSYFISGFIHYQKKIENSIKNMVSNIKITKRKKYLIVIPASIFTIFILSLIFPIFVYPSLFSLFRSINEASIQSNLQVCNLNETHYYTSFYNNFEFNTCNLKIYFTENSSKTILSYKTIFPKDKLSEVGIIPSNKTLTYDISCSGLKIESKSLSSC
jgi:ribosomal protein L36